MNDDDAIDLKNAVRLLENPSLGAKIADIIGTPIEKAIALLPSRATETIGSAAQKAIHGALKLSLKTLDHHDPESGEDPRYYVAVAISIVNQHVVSGLPSRWDQLGVSRGFSHQRSATCNVPSPARTTCIVSVRVPAG